MVEEKVSQCVGKTNQQYTCVFISLREVQAFLLFYFITLQVHAMHHLFPVIIRYFGTIANFVGKILQLISGIASSQSKYACSHCQTMQINVIYNESEKVRL
jgi:hypothetical protein